MRILVTNDDGIHAAGLDACEEIARALSDDVWIVAPEYDQSGVSHSLSLNDPLRLREIGERRFAVKGTPTDCVIMGVRHILDGKGADLVLSGVNRGRNAAEDVLYSGTVAGAKEAAVLGIPALALSQAYASANRDRPFWETAIQHGPDIVRRVLSAGIPRDVLVNVNFPDCPPGEVKGIVLIDGAHEDQMERFPAELSPRAMLAGAADQLRQLAEAASQGEPVPDHVPAPESFPEPLAQAYRKATAPTPDRLETAAAEYDALEESQAQVRSLSTSSLGDTTIVAIRHGVPQPMPGVPDDVNERYEAAWQQMQDELAARSNSGRVVVAEGAGHSIHHDRPDLVVEAIRGLLR